MPSLDLITGGATFGTNRVVAETQCRNNQQLQDNGVQLPECSSGGPNKLDLQALSGQGRLGTCTVTYWRKKYNKEKGSHIM